ncbi:hypothetical protein ABIB25_002429 [Nakamurella sp. UYEF19]|uniref:hypothetical protein n=1 Tax=Nakamurella sp. UYEF19 TaxID=1756392 RepID=UPI00339848D6
MTLLVVDTSVAVPSVLQPRAFHRQVTAWWAGRVVTLSGRLGITGVPSMTEWWLQLRWSTTPC